MSRPLKINNNTSPISLREMSNADIDYIVYRVLHEFANNQSGTGTLNLNGVGTNIGSFVDTSRPHNVGDHPVGTTINTNTISFFQDRNSVTPSPSARPVIWNGSALQEISDSELNSLVMQRAGLSLTNGGIGSYSIATSVPSGGSFITIDSFVDISASGNETYNLYRKVNNSQPATVRPLKTASGDLREMTDNEINTLVDNLRDFILTTNVGFYALQPAPPAGTWLDSGVAEDTRNKVQDQNYVGNFTSNRGYVGQFTGPKTFVGPRTYTGERGFVSARDFARFFSGNFEGNFTSNRTFVGNRNFVGTDNYVGTSTYTGTFTSATTFTGNFTGRTVLSSKDTISTRKLFVRQS